MVYNSIEEIEYYNDLDFREEIVKKYSDIILNIFNNHPYDYNLDDYNQDYNIQIIYALYYLSTNNIDKGKEILLNLHNNSCFDATCTLAVYLKKQNSHDPLVIEYLTHAANNGHILSSINLGFEYYIKGDFDNFLKYTKIGLVNEIDMAYINMGIYHNNITKYDKISGFFFEKALSKNSHRAFYHYSKLNINNKRIEYLMKAIKIKIKKKYLEELIKYTTISERYILCKDYYINTTKFAKYDTSINIYLYNQKLYNYCPIHIDEKVELLQLKCEHSFCINCINKFCKKKCPICN
jgi:hypothetical protein